MKCACSLGLGGHPRSTYQCEGQRRNGFFQEEFGTVATQILGRRIDLIEYTFRRVVHGQCIQQQRTIGGLQWMDGRTIVMWLNLGSAKEGIRIDCSPNLPPPPACLNRASIPPGN